MALPTQPSLPAVTPPTDAEFDFLENSPPGLFPENQNSNFGFKRKLWTDRVQELSEQQMTIYNERFVDSSTQFLDEWEYMLALPVNPTSRTLAQRRQDALGRLARGPFTRARRAAIVEKFIYATFGDPISITSDGVPITSAGVPLYTETADISTLYRIVEDIPNFTYQVRLKNTLSPDMVGLTRELLRVTTAGISFTIVLVAIP